MARLLLVRHGQIAANVSGHWHGSTDSALTETGRTQAEQIALALRSRWQRDGRRAQAIYASPLERTRHTALAIADALELPLELEPDLREYAIGTLEGLHFEELRDRHRLFAAVEADHEFAPSGGESIAGVARRVVSALQRVEARHRDQEVIVVSHGAALGIALGVLLDGDPMRWRHYGIGNCSLTELSLHPRPELHRLNEMGHLDTARMAGTAAMGRDPGGNDAAVEERV